MTAATLLLAVCVRFKVLTCGLFCLSEANVSTSIQVDSTARGSAAAWAILPVCEWKSLTHFHT